MTPPRGAGRASVASGSEKFSHPFQFSGGENVEGDHSLRTHVALETSRLRVWSLGEL